MKECIERGESARPALLRLRDDRMEINGNSIPHRRQQLLLLGSELRLGLLELLQR